MTHYPLDGRGSIVGQLERAVIAAAAAGDVRATWEREKWQFTYTGVLVDLGCTGTVHKLERDGRLRIVWSEGEAPPVVSVP